MNGSRLTRDQIEEIVKADLQKHYPEIEAMEFTLIKIEERSNEWWVSVYIVPKYRRGRMVFYRLDAETGEIKEYRVVV